MNTDKPDAGEDVAKQWHEMYIKAWKFYCIENGEPTSEDDRERAIDRAADLTSFGLSLTAERDELLREVEAARRRGGWTYCEDAFPTKPDEYLITYISIYDGKPASGVAEYVRDEWRYDDGDVFTVPVIAWRPLPEPAEIKRSEDEV